jgi:hypothetical protein
MSEQYPTSFRDLGSSLGTAVVLQLIMGLFAAMMLDGGQCLAGLLIFIALHWLVVIMMAVRRWNCLTKVDVILVRIGFLLYLLGSVMVLMLVGIIVHLLD